MRAVPRSTRIGRAAETLPLAARLDFGTASDRDSSAKTGDGGDRGDVAFEINVFPIVPYCCAYMRKLLTMELR